MSKTKGVEEKAQEPVVLALVECITNIGCDGRVYGPGEKTMVPAKEVDSLVKAGAARLVERASGSAPS